MARWMRVFISYGSEEDFVTALRVQAVAAAEGLDAIVPPQKTREDSSFTEHFHNVDVSSSDIVLGIALQGVTPQMEWELRRARLDQNRLILRSPGVGASLDELYPGNTIALGDAGWIETETRISRAVGSTSLDPEAKRALLGMVLMAAGLHLMAEPKGA